jgi:hypothetical protein
MRGTLFSLTLVLLVHSASAQVPKIDWKSQQAEILLHHRSLVQIDSSNPPGNETLVVDYLKKVFDAENIPAQVFALDPSRANLVARLKGNGSKRQALHRPQGDAIRSAGAPCFASFASAGPSCECSAGLQPASSVRCLTLSSPAVWRGSARRVEGSLFAASSRRTASVLTISRTRLWLAEGWGCRGRHLSTA